MKEKLIILLCILFTINTWASNFTVDGIAYNITDEATKTVSIGEGSTISGALTIPTSVNNGTADYTVTSIEDNAFDYCTALTSVIIQSPIASIGRNAFDGCSALTSVNIPNTVTSIGICAFYNCTALTSITVHQFNPNYSSVGGVLFNKDQTTLIQYPIGNTNTSYSIPSSVTSIENYSFYGCTGLTSVNMLNFITSIGVEAFRYCTKLTSVTIPSSVNYIGIHAFQFCTKLTAINVAPSNIDYSSVDGVLFNKNQTTLIQYPIGNTNTSYSIPSSVTTIGDNAFRECVVLTSLTIPSLVTSIEDYAFKNCTGLTSIHSKSSNPNNINLGTNVFYNITCPLYVPTGLISLYDAADQWTDFTNILEETATAIETLSPAEMNITIQGNTISLFSIELAANVQVVEIDGKVIYNQKARNETLNIDVPNSGVYIVKIGNKVTKVFVR